MDRTERLYRIDRMLNERKVVPLPAFLDELEVSLATFKRDLEYLRDRLNAPVVWDRDVGGYRFDKQGAGDAYELPGLWFSASEIHALLTMQQLLSGLGPGLLTPHIDPLLTRLRLLLDRENIPAEAVEQRVRIQRGNARTYEPEHFAPIATGVLQRRRLTITHYNRQRNQLQEREISPQRLNYYRENWYVDGWCHMRNALRSFSLDAIACVKLMQIPAVDVSDEVLIQTLDVGYGAFAGQVVEWAELLFAPIAARWVSKEVWHPNQVGKLLEDGRYLLRLPFSNPTELAMDVLRHTPDVRVVAPESLRELVRERLRAGLEAEMAFPSGAVRPDPEAPLCSRPLFADKVPAGFPSPATDYQERRIDLNQYLIPHTETTFMLRAKGLSMLGAGINDSDVLIVDRSLTPRHGSVVIAVVDGDFTVKRLHRQNGVIKLQAENPDYPDITFRDGQELSIWGVVTYVIHKL